MDINLELYRVFLVVAECGSISGAARNLFISQPAVTQAIKLLESELGGTLFIRNSRGVALTHEGEMLKQYVGRALELVSAAESRFSEMVSLERGQINIGASDTICKHFLLPYFERFRQQYPHV